MSVRIVCVFFGYVVAVHASPDKYSGDIAEKDMRLAGLKESIVGNGPVPSMRLRYAGIRGDFLAFYDLSGHEAFYRFREDRFDHQAMKKADGLIQGEAYEVKGSLLGVYLGPNYMQRSHPDFASALKNKDSVLVFQFESATSLRLEQILF